MRRDIEKCLMTVRHWAGEKVRNGKEPPWAWYQYMKLVEAVDLIQHGQGRVRPVTGRSLESVGPPTHDPKELALKAESGSAPGRDDEEGPPLPM
jgi:hypothetical protein